MLEANSSSVTHSKCWQVVVAGVAKATAPSLQCLMYLQAVIFGVWAGWGRNSIPRALGSLGEVGREGWYRWKKTPATRSPGTWEPSWPGPLQTVLFPQGEVGAGRPGAERMQHLWAAGPTGLQGGSLSPELR